MTAVIYRQNSSIFKRISSLILLVCSLAIAINLYIMHSQNAQQWYEIESEQLGRSLTIQAARLLSQPMAGEDELVISSYTDMLNQGMFIEGAVVFDDQGVKLSDTQDPVSVITMVKESDYEPLVFVEDIVYEGQILGYVKLILNREEITRHHRSFNRNQLSQSILLMLLAMIISMLATRMFYKFKRRYSAGEDENKLL
jgi:membrane protein